MAKKSIEQQNIDEMKVLDTLQQHGNESIALLSKKCGLTPQKTRKIIKNLEKKKIILGYTAIIDEQKLGLQKFVLLIKRSSTKLESDMANKLASEQLGGDLSQLGITIDSSYFVHGEYDWALVFSAPELNEAKRLVGLILSKYPHFVSKYLIIQILMTLESNHIVNNDSLAKLRDFL